MSNLKYLVIHCTDTPEGRDVTPADIRGWHLLPPPRGNGWKQVGYTDLIRLDGTIDRLVDNNEDANVDTWEVTNGAKGFNSVSRHIVYAGGRAATGNKPKDTRNAAQLKAMEQYVRGFHLQHPAVKIVGHRDLDKGKACPSFDVGQWLATIGIKQ